MGSNSFKLKVFTERCNVNEDFFFSVGFDMGLQQSCNIQTAG